MADLDLPAETSAFRKTLKVELLGPPRPTRAAQFCAVAFGLLLVGGLIVSSLSPADAPAPGWSLTMAGLMVMCGFAELIDSNQRNFVVALRFGGAATALIGLLLQLL